MDDRHRDDGGRGTGMGMMNILAQGQWTWWHRDNGHGGMGMMDMEEQG